MFLCVLWCSIIVDYNGDTGFQFLEVDFATKSFILSVPTSKLAASLAKLFVPHKALMF